MVVAGPSPGPGFAPSAPSPSITPLPPLQFSTLPKLSGDHSASLIPQPALFALRPGASPLTGSLSPSTQTQSHGPNTLSFPDTPTTELPPIQLHNARNPSASLQTLPPLSSVTGSQTQRFSPPQQQQQQQQQQQHSEPLATVQPSPSPAPNTHWPSLNPFTAYYSPSHVQSPDARHHMDRDVSVASPDRYYDRRSGSVSLDDPAVRMAAEALEGLRTDFVSSPPNRNTPLPNISRDYSVDRSHRESVSEQPGPEPLLSLITAQVPALGATISGASSAYNHGKNYSPHLKTGAEYVEGYLSPVVKVVGNVGRKTGVEGGVRWILGGRRRHKVFSDLESGERGNNKRRKVKPSETEADAPSYSSEFVGHDKDRRTSTSTIDTLPAYDDQTTPAYTETDQEAYPQSRPGSSSSSWGKGKQLMVTTSGLSVAMRDESLHSLKFCCKTLRTVIASIDSALLNLKATIEKYDAATSKDGDDDDDMTTGPDSRSELMARMTSLKQEIYRSIGAAVNIISKYAGSALPQNARDLVYSHLMSLPRRFPWQAVREISDEQRQGGVDQEKATREGANVVLQFAKEGLDMMTTVNDILDRTIISAEKWVDTLYTKKRDHADSSMGNTTPTPSSASLPYRGDYKDIRGDAEADARMV
ncbi:transcription factor Opi1-domain-containing protein [Bombardia bombarda]|uniref:Transcription factor Opi1-domain-containing protein n=1 Tax=Bombardia bombarda TaxID=252184 RepID=A0AA39TJK0_9PEZI|nr:transcription factor Opi1-domain-containing protein [Bombardia bombarda]